MIERETAVQTPRRLVRGGLGLVLGAMLAACGSTGTDKPVNAAPIANAGADQSAKVDFAVTLDGSKSADPEGVPLKFFWGIASKPKDSKLVLSTTSTSAAKPTFTLDVAGEYVFRLLVSDGVNVSAPAFVKVTAAVGNYPPVADAGKAQTVGAGALVTLDGSASDDRNKDPLTFAWTLTTKPDGSAAMLSGADTAHPTFSPDLVGTYVASLVVSDGQEKSAPATVTITAQAGNIVPIADPSLTPTNAVVHRPVTLNGSASKDGNNDPLTYAWTLTGKPASSAAALDDATAASPKFTPDLAGDYVAQLVVYDGKDHSTPATVTVTAVPNVPPVANAGPAQNVIPGTLATLDGTGSSDANGDAVTYAWTTVSSPAASEAVLMVTTTAHPSFIPDVAGSVAASWEFQLVVDDGLDAIAPSTVTITTTRFMVTPEFFAPYLDPAVSTSLNFQTTATPVAKAPVRFYSATPGALKMYQKNTTFAVNYGGNSIPGKGTAAPYAAWAVGDVVPVTAGTNTSTNNNRFVSMPYSPIAEAVTATVFFSYSSSQTAACSAAQILLVKADGTVIAQQNVCGLSSVTSLSATFTDPTNTEVYVLFTRVSDGGGGLRVHGLTLTKG